MVPEAFDEYRIAASRPQRGSNAVQHIIEAKMNWPAPFVPIDNPEQQRGFADELAREMSPGHALYGVPTRAIGKRLDRDDILFELTDSSGRLAEVHLTWKANDRPPWPHAIVFSSLEQWIDSPHHAEEKC
jgi:hypothetical protein